MQVLSWMYTQMCITCGSQVQLSELCVGLQLITDVTVVCTVGLWHGGVSEWPAWELSGGIHWHCTGSEGRTRPDIWCVFTTQRNSPSWWLAIQILYTFYQCSDTLYMYWYSTSTQIPCQSTCTCDPSTCTWSCSTCHYLDHTSDLSKL